MVSPTHAFAQESEAYFDPKIGARARSVLPGRHLVIDEPDVAVVTLLGSCVAACVRDVETGVGGLNHFLLPGDESKAGASTDSGSLRYGVNAMEILINDILRRGGAKQRLEAKVFGGANVIDTAATETVGDRNGRFVIDYLSREGVRVAASDIGGDRARRVFFFPSTGRASVLRLPVSDTRKLRREEAKMHDVAKVAAPKAGAVELF